MRTLRYVWSVLDIIISDIGLFLHQSRVCACVGCLHVFKQRQIDGSRGATNCLHVLLGLRLIRGRGCWGDNLSRVDDSSCFGLLEPQGQRCFHRTKSGDTFKNNYYEEGALLFSDQYQHDHSLPEQLHVPDHAAASLHCYHAKLHLMSQKQVEESWVTFGSILAYQRLTESSVSGEKSLTLRYASAA